MRHLILFALLCSSFAARAQGTIETDAGSLTEQRSAQRWRLTAGLVNYRYEEPGYMNIHGRMSQVTGDYRYQLQTQTPSFVAMEGSVAYAGSNRYDGGIQDLEKGTITPASTSSRDYIFEARGLYGLTLIDGYAQGVDVFGGLGSWMLYNKISGNYSRQATYLYLPLGSTYNVRFGRLLLSLTGEYDLYLTGSTTSMMSEVGGSGDIVHQQNSGSGYRAKFNTEYAFNSFTLLAGVYLQAWNIAQSQSTDVNIRMPDGSVKPGVVIEPKNRTTMTGLTIGARF